MLRAYIDDSGEMARGTVFVLGGLMAPINHWLGFETEWISELAQAPKLEYFKAAEANGMRGQFAPRYGWTRELRDQKVDKLCAIIRKWAVARLHVSINVKDFQQFSREAGGPNTHNAQKPYWTAFWNILSMIMEIQLSGTDVPNSVEFIFDQQGKIGGEAQASLNEIYEEMIDYHIPNSKVQYRDIIKSSPIFRNDKEVVPLQAADLYAWSIRRAWHNHLNTGTQVPHRILRNLFDIPTCQKHIALQDLREALANGLRGQ